MARTNRWYRADSTARPSGPVIRLPAVTSASRKRRRSVGESSGSNSLSASSPAICGPAASSSRSRAMRDSCARSVPAPCGVDRALGGRGRSSSAGRVLGLRDLQVRGRVERPPERRLRQLAAARADEILPGGIIRHPFEGRVEEPVRELGHVFGAVAHGRAGRDVAQRPVAGHPVAEPAQQHRHLRRPRAVVARAPRRARGTASARRGCPRTGPCRRGAAAGTRASRSW